MDYTKKLKELDERIRDREETLNQIESSYERQKIYESIAQLKEERAKMVQKQHDAVKSPAHYTEGRNFEPKDVIRDWGLDFNLGSTVKYIARAGRKDDILQDLNKAKEFLQFEIEAIEAERNGSVPPVDHPNCGCSFEQAIKHSEQIGKEKHKEKVNNIIKDMVAGMAGVELITDAEISDNEVMVAVVCRGDVDPDEAQEHILDELHARLKMM